jgi:hypothetical protein
MENKFEMTNQAYIGRSDNSFKNNFRKNQYELPETHLNSKNSELPS